MNHQKLESKSKDKEILRSKLEFFERIHEVKKI